MATTSNYGLVITGDNQVSSLYNANRDYNNRLTWQDLYNSNSLAGSNAVSQLQKSYTDATTQAYISYLQNKNALASSGVVGSAKASAMQAYDNSLQSTMDSYASSLSEGVSSINDAVSENQSAITEALQTQADYTADYTNAHYSYLEQLYEDYLNGENTLFDSTVWSNYLTIDPELDDEGNEQYDDEGNLIGDTRLKTWAELVNPSYEEHTDENGNVTKEYTSLFDENGNLTGKGTDFFDQMENANATSKLGTSFGEYLYNTNEDLYNWANSYNYYNYTQAGTNAGTVKTMYGMMSTDESWSYAERLGGMTSSQIESTFSEFNEAVDKLNSYNTKTHAQDMQSYLVDTLTAASSLLKDLGIDQDLENETGMSLTDYINDVSSKITYSNGSINTDLGLGISSILIGVGLAIAGVATFAASGGTAAVGSAALMDGAAATITTGISSVDSADAKKAANEQVSAEMKQIYNQFLVNLTDYVQLKKTNRNTPSIIY